MVLSGTKETYELVKELYFESKKSINGFKETAYKLLALDLAIAGFVLPFFLNQIIIIENISGVLFWAVLIVLVSLGFSMLFFCSALLPKNVMYPEISLIDEENSCCLDNEKMIRLFYCADRDLKSIQSKVSRNLQLGIYSLYLSSILLIIVSILLVVPSMLTKII